MQLIILSVLIGACAAGFAGYPQAQPQAQAYNQQYQYRPRSNEGGAAILRSDAQLNENDFHYAYETQNGIQAQESGHEADGIEAQGGYSYTGDDGQVYSVQYTAGHDGFQVQGAHIPTPPPVPEAIARALQQNAADEASGIFDDGSYHDGKYGSSDSGSGVVAARAFQPARQYLAPQAGFRNTGYRY